MVNPLTCHCKKVKLEVELGDSLNNLVKCNCSICTRRGAIMAIVKSENVKIIEGKEILKTYQFHTKVAKHFFCSNCGIYTHHNQRRNPELVGINTACLEGVDKINYKKIKLLDGQNHPLDKK
ncbi:MAG: aldehyde-activating protein [Pelagibacteraceae bacterium TMED216]|nr:MAG: aldehyde-activating protein [Pelagibacteraceae bacterium TMED216]|tara:strand:+ start:1829 stop:2194 length:366 start_codon:yes stop_codon:yes gene_type:complete